jgi:hypothetical protein
MTILLHLSSCPTTTRYCWNGGGSRDGGPAGEPCEWCFVAIDNSKEEVGCRRTYRGINVRTKTSCEAQGIDFIWCPAYHENDSTLPDRPTVAPTTARPTRGGGRGGGLRP